MLLGHTIVAMVGDRIAKVRCNTCQGQHAFRPHPPGTRSAASGRSGGEGRIRPAARRGSEEKAEVRPFEDLFAGRDASEAKPYAPRERFEAGDILAHPTFGLGLVRAARHDKIDVVFKLGEKTLIHGLPGGSRKSAGAARARTDAGASAAGGAPADLPEE